MPLTKKAETETKVEEVVMEEAKEKPEVGLAEVATKPETGLAEQRQQGIKQYIDEMASIGLEGIEIGGFSFDRIKLHEGEFQIGSDDSSLGKEIEFQVVTSRPIYAVSQSSDDDADMFYSYDKDGKTDTNGNSTEDKLQEWIEDGYNPDIRRYLEVMAFLKNRDDEYDETPVSLSIPPTSVQRFGGLTMIASTKFKATLLDVVCVAKVGATVGSGPKAFRPWVFSVKGLAE